MARAKEAGKNLAYTALAVVVSPPILESVSSLLKTVPQSYITATSTLLGGGLGRYAGKHIKKHSESHWTGPSKETIVLMGTPAVIGDYAKEGTAVGMLIGYMAGKAADEILEYSIEYAKPVAASLALLGASLYGIGQLVSWRQQVNRTAAHRMPELTVVSI